MLRAGLTGNIGTGKSTVGRMFAELGCRVIDADVIAHRLFEPGESVNRRVAEAFGPEVVGAGGAIDRRVLGEMVFRDAGLRQKLNGIVHPEIIRKQAGLLAAIEAEDPAAIAIVEAALMVEAGTYKNYDKLIVVACTPEMQRRRLARRSGLTAAQIEARIAAQLPMEEKIRYADFVIDNSGDRAATRRQVEDVYRRLRALAG